MIVTVTDLAGSGTTGDRVVNFAVFGCQNSDGMASIMTLERIAKSAPESFLK